MNLGVWRLQMEAEIEQLRNLDLGYELDENVIFPPGDPGTLLGLNDAAGLEAESPLSAFYRACGGVSLPDAHVGYFVHKPELVVRGLSSGEPRRITGAFEGDVLVFGSDGGGGRFALVPDGFGEVLYLGEGAVHDAVFDGTYGEVRLLADNLEKFLSQLLADLAAFVRSDPAWTYMI
jgi:hypothetical protein